MDEFRKRLGQMIMSLNTDILILQKGYKSLKDSNADQSRKEATKKSTEETEKRVKEKKGKLENARTYLTNNPSMMESNKKDKYLKLLNTTIETAEKCLELKSNTDEDLESVLDKTVTEVQETIREDNEEDRSLEDITNQLEGIPEPVEIDLSEEIPVTEDDEEKNEFTSLSHFEQERYNRKVNDIEKNFKTLRVNLKTKWENEGELLDALALRDHKF